MAAIAKKQLQQSKPAGRPKGGRIGPPVTGKVVSIAELGELEFGVNGSKQSHYAKLLTELQAAPAGSVLQFESVGCRFSISTRARKLGLKVLFATRDGKLYVKIDPTMHLSNKDRIRQALQTGPMTAIEASNYVRAHGNENMDAQIAEGLLAGMVKSGEASRCSDNRFRLVNGGKK